MIRWGLKIASWFFGGKNPLEALTSAYIKYKDSELESERIKADIIKKQIDVELDAQAASRTIRLATKDHWEQRLTTFLLVWPNIVHMYLVYMDTIGDFVWSIPVLPSPFDDLQILIVGSYFGLYGLNKIAATIAVRK